MRIPFIDFGATALSATGKENMKSKHTGFTLIELLIVVAIIGIIAAIAYPSYQQHVRKSARSDAQVGLMRMADSQETFYLQNNRYGTTAEIGAPVTENSFYLLTVTAANTNSFTLTATATGAQAADAGCTAITLNQALLKLPAACW